MSAVRIEGVRGSGNTGYWKIQAPDGTLFGVGQYSQSLSVSIVVGSGTPENNKTQSVYDITAVGYDRNNQALHLGQHILAYLGCTSTSNGPSSPRSSFCRVTATRPKGIKLQFDGGRDTQLRRRRVEPAHDHVVAQSALGAGDHIRADLPGVAYVPTAVPLQPVAAALVLVGRLLDQGEDLPPVEVIFRDRVPGSGELERTSERLSSCTSRRRRNRS